MDPLTERDAIDMHVHVHVGPSDVKTEDTDGDVIRGAAKRYFGSEKLDASIPGIASYYRKRNMAAVVFTVDSETFNGRSGVPNEAIAEGAAAHPDVLIPFGSVDPWKGHTARTAVRRLVRDHGVRGFKFHPSLQGFDPSDRRFYPLYQEIADAGLPVVFHTGQTGIGAGLPGGGGIKLRFSDPMLIDDVAADHPELTIILAHPSVPWGPQGLAMAQHKANVFIDLSGWSPKYFEERLVQLARRRLTHKFLFGSDYPMLSPDRWMKDFQELPLDSEARRKILRDNALDVLGIAPDVVEHGRTE